MTSKFVVHSEWRIIDGHLRLRETPIPGVHYTDSSSPTRRSRLLLI
jgi:hypothetical protein